MVSKKERERLRERRGARGNIRPARVAVKREREQRQKPTEFRRRKREEDRRQGVCRKADGRRLRRSDLAGRPRAAGAGRWRPVLRHSPHASAEEKIGRAHV